jgi:AcrR family transcriptional regulator
MPSEESGATPGREIHQERGRRTYEALITTGFALLERYEFDEITISDLEREAGYSVGAFYARFHSKDEFLSALVAQHLDYRNRIREQMFAEADPATLADELIRELVTYYWKHRRFWRAALMRGMRDPQFWRPFHRQSRLSIAALTDKLAELAGRELTEDERDNVRYALQIALGMINNAIVNRPGPTFDQGKKKFVENLVRAFRLVSDYDRLTGR